MIQLQRQLQKVLEAGVKLALAHRSLPENVRLLVLLKTGSPLSVTAVAVSLEVRHVRYRYISLTCNWRKEVCKDQQGPQQQLKYLYDRPRSPRAKRAVVKRGPLLHSFLLIKQ